MVGIAVSIISDCEGDDVSDTFPTGSVAVAVIVYVPALIVGGVIDHTPPETAAEPILIKFPYNVMVSPLIPVPVIVGVVSLVGVVIWSMVGGSGAVMSTVIPLFPPIVLVSTSLQP